ncbi:MAG: carboxypeptidase-like regulatory domain-containing protein [Planctomycetota bacterium]|nr:carboxypeptidase-like regulatory domain-containing protein [Planctomycetota bacterium]
MQRLQTLAVALAALVGLAALLWILLGGQPPPEPVYDLREAPVRVAPDDLHSAERPTSGGVYGGRVLTLEGVPIHGARVLLVAYQGGQPDVLAQGAGADPDPDALPDIPVVGGYDIGGEEATDADGRFRIAADGQSTITRVLAYHQGHFLSVVEVTRPREDLELRLQPAGRVIGRVVDDETGEPIPGALIDLYLQQKVDKVPDGIGTYGVVRRKTHETAWLATLGRFIGKTLGPRIWNVSDSTSEALKLRTDKNGRFEIGPLGDSVQLEFVITHTAYKWVDFDSKDGTTTPERLVVKPGETIEREFRLKRGLHVAGQVVDEEGKGVPDVFIKVQSISAYYRHWWYVHKWRFARTDADGRFRVDGLALGSQQIVFQHPTFHEITEAVEAGTEDFLVVIERFGALQGRLDGIASAGERRRIRVMFEALDENYDGPRQIQRSELLDAGGTFLVSRLTPGKYRAWVTAGQESSQPIEVEIKALELTGAIFEVGTGGTLLLRVMDDRGGVVDPANGRLVSLAEGRQRSLGSYVSREGEFSVEGIAPGRYLLEVSSSGRIPTASEPFEVSAGRVTNLGALTLRRFGFLRVGLPVNERGRPAKLAEDLIIEVRTADGVWQRVYNVGTDLAVPPGAVTYRARSGALTFEETVEIVPGETREAPIVFEGG